MESNTISTLFRTKHDAINNISFNQDCSCFSLGTNKGFVVFDCDPIKERFRRENMVSQGVLNVQTVKMLYRSNILALVCKGKSYTNNKVVIWDDKECKAIGTLDCPSEVKGVTFLRKEKVIAILEDKICVFNLSDLNLEEEINTYKNPTGLCSVQSSNKEITLACLGDTSGTIKLFDEKHGTYHTIKAHLGDIIQLCLDDEGKKVATASKKGTLIRIFDTRTRNKIMELRRGTLAAKINSIAFNKSGTILCASSDHGTIHIFNCEKNGEDLVENKISSLSYLATIAPIFGSSWSSKSITMYESYSLCAFGNIYNGKQIIYVLGSSGRYYKYYISKDTDPELEAIKDFI